MRIQASGRTGQDAMIRVVESTKKKILVFSIAESSSKIDKKTNLKIETTTWIDIVLPYERYENAAQYIKKNTIVDVSGTPRINQYKDPKTNTLISKIGINGIDVKFYFPPKDDTETTTTGPKTEITTHVNTETDEISDGLQPNTSFDSINDDDDLPF